MSEAAAVDGLVFVDESLDLLLDEQLASASANAEAATTLMTRVVRVGRIVNKFLSDAGIASGTAPGPGSDDI
jgi:hypothetical protein